MKVVVSKKWQEYQVIPTLKALNFTVATPSILDTEKHPFYSCLTYCMQNTFMKLVISCVNKTLVRRQKRKLFIVKPTVKKGCCALLWANFSPLAIIFCSHTRKGNLLPLPTRLPSFTCNHYMTQLTSDPRATHKNYYSTLLQWVRQLIIFKGLGPVFSAQALFYDWSFFINLCLFWIGFFFLAQSCKIQFFEKLPCNLKRRKS